MKNNNKGFSLVELLIAVAVSSIVLSALVMLISQSVRSYSKQTALAQIQSDADVTLNQISKNILEATVVALKKDSSGNVQFYTKKDAAGIFYGYYYDKSKKTLYYTDNTDISVAGKKMSVVCEDVESFDVRIDTANFKLKADTTIEELPRNPKLVVDIGLKRMNETRNVQRTYVTRNEAGKSIYLPDTSTGNFNQLTAGAKQLSDFASGNYFIQRSKASEESSAGAAEPTTAAPIS